MHYIFSISAIIQFVFAFACALHNDKIISQVMLVSDELKTVKRFHDVSFKQWLFLILGMTLPAMLICSLFNGAFMYVIAIVLVAAFVHGNLLVTILRTAIILSLFIKIIFFL